jgi:hypothetical protein
MQEMYVASDGWPFYVQPNGTLTDTPNPDECDLGWDSLEQFFGMDEGARKATQQEREHYAKVREGHYNV